VHIPALRRWCYPLMEGRPLESREPRALDWSANPRLAHRSPKPLRRQTLYGDLRNRVDRYLGSYLAAGLLNEHRDKRIS